MSGASCDIRFLVLYVHYSQLILMFVQTCAEIQTGLVRSTRNWVLRRAITPEWAIRRSSGCCWGCETGARVYCVKRRVEIMSCGCTSARYTHASIHTRLWCNSLCPKGLVSKHWYMHFHRYHSHRTYLTDLLALYTKTLGQYYVHSNGTCDRLTRLPVDKTGLGGSQ